MKEVYSIKHIDSKATDVDVKEGIVTGYLSSFNTIDSDNDVIIKGAFAKSIKDNGPDSARPRIKHLLNHNPEKTIGKFTLLKEDEQGLYYESKIGNHDLGKDFLKMVDSGLITEHSIGFQVLRNERDAKSSTNGTPIRRIIEVKLWEGSSLTAWGANENTPMTGIKSLNTEAQINYYQNKSEAIEKFCRNTDCTDETIDALLIYCKQLTQTIIELQAPMPEVKTTEAGNDLITAIDNFLLTNLKF